MGNPNTGEIYEGDLRNSTDVALNEAEARRLKSLDVEERIRELTSMAAVRSASPDLRTLEGQLSYLDYHAPDATAQKAHQHVNGSFQQLWETIAGSLPDGPGKTRALHAVNEARMSCNNCIANKGA